MPKIKTGYSNGIFVHGKCVIVPTEGKYLVQAINQITRPDGSEYRTFGELRLVNKDEVSDIQEEEI